MLSEKGFKFAGLKKLRREKYQAGGSIEGRREEAGEVHSSAVHQRGQEEAWDNGSHVTGLDLGRHTEEWSSCPVLLYLNTEYPASGAV